METETTTVETPTTPKQAKPKKAKTAKKESQPLRAAQVRMLKHLKKKDRPCSRAELVVAATQRENGTLDGSYLGNRGPKERAIADKKAGRPSLITRGFVRMIEADHDGKKEILFDITAAGKKALERI